MSFPFLTIVNFPFEVISGVVAALICKAYFSAKTRKIIDSYQNEIIKNQEKIFELEVLNDHLQKRIKDLESYFSKDRISMN